MYIQVYTCTVHVYIHICTSACGWAAGREQACVRLQFLVSTYVHAWQRGGGADEERLIGTVWNL